MQVDILNELGNKLRKERLVRFFWGGGVSILDELRNGLREESEVGQVLWVAYFG